VGDAVAVAPPGVAVAVPVPAPAVAVAVADGDAVGVRVAVAVGPTVAVAVAVAVRVGVAAAVAVAVAVRVGVAAAVAVAVAGGGLGGRIRGDGEVYVAFDAAVVGGAKEMSLRRVGVVGGSGRAGTAGGGHRVVDAAHLVDREVGEAYSLPGEGVSERGEVNDR